MRCRCWWKWFGVKNAINGVWVSMVSYALILVPFLIAFIAIHISAFGTFFQVVLAWFIGMCVHFHPSFGTAPTDGKHNRQHQPSLRQINVLYLAPHLQHS